MIVTLEDPAAAAAAHARQLAGLGPRRKLSLATPFARSHLARIDAAQRSAISRLHAQIPQAVVSRRFRILLNGLTVSVPYARLPELLRLDFGGSMYPSRSYALSLNRGPAVIGAPQFSAATGAGGAGVKVAVVDDGVDHEHRSSIRPGTRTHRAT